MARQSRSVAARACCSHFCICLAGRQARERGRLLGIVKRQRQIEDKRSLMGVPLSHDEAARRIQAAVRGYIWRRRIQRGSDLELQFIGMKPKPRDPKKVRCFSSAAADVWVQGLSG
eukprot:355754-Chlamydomonas_euryale.AAC.2